MTRRAGQLIKKGPRKWVARTYLGEDARGKRRYHSKTIHGTKKDAEAYLTKVLRDRDLGTFVEPSSVAFTDYFEEWLEQSARPRVAPKTLQDYRALVDRHVLPALGTFRLSQITAFDVQRLYNGLVDGGLSARTVRYIHSVIHSALEQAVRRGLLARNVAKLVDLPRQERREMQVLTPEQVPAFLTTAREDRWGPLWELLLTTGMRPAEALGLKWTDVQDGEIVVQRSLVRLSDGSWHLKEPKTPRARRTIPISEGLARTLRTHRAVQASEQLEAGPTYKSHELVFATSNGSPLDWRVTARRHFTPILNRAQLPKIRPYDLRHTCATHLLALGVNPKVVSELLGHASIVQTLDTYTHVLPPMQRDAVSRLEDLYAGVRDIAQSGL